MFCDSHFELFCVGLGSQISRVPSHLLVHRIEGFPHELVPSEVHGTGGTHRVSAAFCRTSLYSQFSNLWFKKYFKHVLN